MIICPLCVEPIPDEPPARCPDHPECAPLVVEVTEDEPFVGTLVADRYAVLARAGRLAAGTHYRAWDRETGREVGLTTLAPAVVEGSAVAHELTLAACLESPATSPPRAHGELPGGGLFVVSDWLGAETLLDVLARRGRLPLSVVRRIGLAVCESLSEAHALGLVHRDLCPLSLRLRPGTEGGEHAVVCGFGLPKQADPGAGQLARSEDAVDPLHATSPEQLDGLTVGPSADIYALGVTLHHLTTGAAPFSGPTPLATMYKHISEAPPRLSDRLGSSPNVTALDAIIQRCLRKRPEERFPDVRALARTLAALPADGAVAVDPIDRRRTPTRRSLRAILLEEEEKAQVAATVRRLSEPKFRARNGLSDITAVDPAARRARRRWLTKLAVAFSAGLLALFLLVFTLAR